MAANRRIAKEWADLQADPVENVSVAPDESNMLKWTGMIIGPAGTPYAGGTFKISIDYPVRQLRVVGADRVQLEFPFKAPTVKFLTRIYHMNVTDDGGICIGLTKAESWKPSTKTRAILLSLVQLLQEPNTDDALVATINEQYRTNRKKHDEDARAATLKYAS